MAITPEYLRVHGVMAYYVQQHTKDISIRLALGGSPRDVLGLVLAQGMQMVATGLALGGVIAFVGTRLMSTVLFGVAATDAVTFAAAGTFLLAVALLACFVQAKRASGLQPATVLRNDREIMDGYPSGYSHGAAGPRRFVRGLFRDAGQRLVLKRGEIPRADAGAGR